MACASVENQTSSRYHYHCYPRQEPQSHCRQNIEFQRLDLPGCTTDPRNLGSLEYARYRCRRHALKSTTADRLDASLESRSQFSSASCQSTLAWPQRRPNHANESRIALPSIRHDCGTTRPSEHFLHDVSGLRVLVIQVNNTEQAKRDGAARNPRVPSPKLRKLSPHKTHQSIVCIATAGVPSSGHHHSQRLRVPWRMLMLMLTPMQGTSEPPSAERTRRRRHGTPTLTPTTQARYVCICTRAEPWQAAAATDW